MRIFTERYPLKDETYAIIGACMEVHRELGCGFLEAVYQEAVAIEFGKRGVPFEKEKALDVFYKGVKLSKTFYADFVCFGSIILELKALKEIHSSHLSQVLNYLKATGLNLGLIVNFGQSSLEYKRVILR